jgi:RNA polymerase sigma factor (sigma-70 family)
LHRLYERWAPRLHGIALRITGQPALAADATHDAFVQVWQQAVRFDPARGSGEAWLVSLARYRALDIVRRRRREVLTDAPPEQEDAAPDALALLARSAEGAALRRCLAALEPDRRQLIVLAFVQGLSHSELAERVRRAAGHREILGPPLAGGAARVSRPMSDDPGRDLLAGEYVLGTLEPAERDAAAALAAQDPDFARAVAAWERRLAPLAGLAPPAPPPGALWGRIGASIDALAGAAGAGPATPEARATPAGPAPAPRRLGLRFWQGTTAGALALAAVLAGLIVLRPAPTIGLAVLVPRAGGPALLALAGASGEVTIRPAGALAPVPPGREMELWALPPGARHPRPLGALPPGGRRLRLPMAPGTEMMVSLEPAGGSPTGLPTGLVLYAGRLEKL